MRIATIGLLLILSSFSFAAVDLTGYDPACRIKAEHQGQTLRLSWTDSQNHQLSAEFDLADGKPLISTLSLRGPSADQTVLARSIDPQYFITVGSRRGRQLGYVFFDKPADRSHQKHTSNLTKTDIRIKSAGTRLTASFSKLTAGPFTGELNIHIYDGSPLLHFEAALSIDQDNIAYIYDAVLTGPFKQFAWKNLSDQFESTSPSGDWNPLAVRNRTIMATADSGTLAVFPPPHAFFYPRDWTNNFKFAQLSKNGFGLRQDPAGGGAFVPWFDAPVGKTQRMGMFLLLSLDAPEKTLDQVKRYTNNDSFKPMPGRVTFTSHYHSRLAVNEMKGTSVAAEFVKVWKDMNVNIIHLSEFHGDGHWNDPGPLRLPEMKAMFDVCRKYSDDKCLLIPGEEGIRFLGNAAGKDHPGHWMYLFPKEVYLTFVRSPDQPFSEKIDPFGAVYHIGSKDDMFELLKRENGLAWSTHPRIKASIKTPDAFKDEPFYKSDHWLGAAWKAMPGDLSEDRLGRRCLDLLDDMNNWGQKKWLPAEVDVFELDRSHELYGHMNINYLKLDKVPSYNDWSPVLTALRTGDYFITTGEVLIHDFSIRDGKPTADIERNFPLQYAELIVSDGQRITRYRKNLPDTKEFARSTITWDANLKTAKWIRLEVWDIALNGAFTQPIWINNP